MPNLSLADIRIPATDGFTLDATIFQPGIDSSNTVLIVPATGVLRRIYSDYACFLSSRGFTVVTWDWRGIGGSRPQSLRGFHATMRDWGERDLTGVIEWAANNTPPKITAVGHSFGGQCIGLASNRLRLERLVTIATQSGYWGLWPKPASYKYASLWYVLIPGLSRALGWFPSKWFGLGEDLPLGVALEWAKWCRSNDYMGNYTGHQSFKAPILALSFTDDPYAPAAAVDWIHERYGSTSKEIRHLTPKNLGIKRAGHFGFFKEGLMPGLWEETAKWLVIE